MTIHTLKLYSNDWIRLFEGTLTFDIRPCENRIQKGDLIIYRAWDKDERKFIVSAPFHDLRRLVGDMVVIDSERVVFSLLKETK